LEFNDQSVSVRHSFSTIALFNGSQQDLFQLLGTKRFYGRPLTNSFLLRYYCIFVSIFMSSLNPVTRLKIEFITRLNVILERHNEKTAERIGLIRHSEKPERVPLGGTARLMHTEGG
jgi:hypothetical protein